MTVPPRPDVVAHPPPPGSAIGPKTSQGGRRTPQLRDINIAANLRAFQHDRAPGTRYASFDYCFNYFQEAREQNALGRLVDADRLELSCLQLGFYLASWGMLRGSSQLLQRSFRDLIPVVHVIATEPEVTWALDVPQYALGVERIFDVRDRLRGAFTFTPSDTLITKVMLGVFGNVPAFDRYFRDGLGVSTFNRPALGKVSDFYQANRSTLDAVKIATIDLNSGHETGRRYAQAKLIDMVFFQEGVQRGAPDLSSPSA